MNKPYKISAEQRREFIAEMNKKWQRKHDREEAWLNFIDDYADVTDMTPQSGSVGSAR